MNKATRSGAISTFFALSLLLLSACGGGGGGDNPPTPPAPPAGSSDWDQMVWDTDNWG